MAKKTRKLISVLSFLLLVAHILTACEKVVEQEDSPSKTAAATEQQPKDSTTLTLRANTEWDSNDGGQTDPDGTLSVEEALMMSTGSTLRVRGIIVGACARSISNAEFAPPFSYDQALLVADREGERNEGRILAVNLTEKQSMRKVLNLVDHPELHGATIVITGTLQNYLGIVGLKDITEYSFM